MCVGGGWGLILPVEVNLPSAGSVTTLDAVEFRSGRCFTLSRLAKVFTRLDTGSVRPRLVSWLERDQELWQQPQD